MNSMTGFGEAEKKTPMGTIRIEVKTLNHKFKDLIFNLPLGYSFLEESLKKRLKKIKRGRINFTLQITPEIKKKITINKGLVKSYFEAVRELKKDFGLRQDLTIDMILGLPGVLEVIEDKEEKGKKISKFINLTARRAIENLISARRREGEAIYRDLRERIKIIENFSKLIKERQKQFLKEKEDTFTNPEDWEVFLKNTDITEEITRLGFHLRNFKKTASIKTRAVGKELDFISQELMREATTVAAKSPDKDIIFNLIRMKAEIEKIREQLQNVE